MSVKFYRNTAAPVCSPHVCSSCLVVTVCAVLAVILSFSGRLLVTVSPLALPFHSTPSWSHGGLTCKVCPGSDRFYPVPSPGRHHVSSAPALPPSFFPLTCRLPALRSESTLSPQAWTLFSLICCSGTGPLLLGTVASLVASLGVLPRHPFFTLFQATVFANLTHPHTHSTTYHTTHIFNSHSPHNLLTLHSHTTHTLPTQPVHPTSTPYIIYALYNPTTLTSQAHILHMIHLPHTCPTPMQPVYFTHSTSPPNPTHLHSTHTSHMLQTPRVPNSNAQTEKYKLRVPVYLAPCEASASEVSTGREKERILCLFVLQGPNPILRFYALDLVST